MDLCVQVVRFNINIYIKDHRRNLSSASRKMITINDRDCLSLPVWRVLFICKLEVYRKYLAYGVIFGIVEMKTMSVNCPIFHHEGNEDYLCFTIKRSE